MKTSPWKQCPNAGSVLLIALGVIFILVFLIGSYLWLVRAQNVSVVRSQAWNAAMAMAEAGIEEGMAQINSVFGTNNMGSANINGWTGPSGGKYGPKMVTLTNGSYSAVIDVSGPIPVITSTGYTTVPAISATLSRTVRVTAATKSAFSSAMVALQDITFNGNYINVDSYDSSDPNHNTGGMYDYAKRKAGGDVASTYGSVDVQNGDVKGKLYTGPDGGYNISQNGSVGDLSWNGPGIQPGWYKNDFNMEIPDVAAPYPPGTRPRPTYLPLTNAWVLGGLLKEYYMDELDLKSGDTMIVTGALQPNGDNDVVKLYVKGNVSMAGGATIVIQPGVTLKLYVGEATGPSTSTTFTQVNTDGKAKGFEYFGLPNNTKITWTGNDQYVGCVYAPQAEYTLGGGGRDIRDYQGACVVRRIVLNGHFNFHYDEALKENGSKIGYVVRSWREL